MQGLAARQCHAAGLIQSHMVHMTRLINYPSATTLTGRTVKLICHLMCFICIRTSCARECLVLLAVQKWCQNQIWLNP